MRNKYNDIIIFVCICFSCIFVGTTIQTWCNINDFANNQGQVEQVYDDWIDCGNNIVYKIIIIDNSKYIVFNNNYGNIFVLKAEVTVEEHLSKLEDTNIEHFNEK